MGDEERKLWAKWDEAPRENRRNGVILLNSRMEGQKSQLPSITARENARTMRRIATIPEVVRIIVSEYFKAKES